MALLERVGHLNDPDSSGEEAIAGRVFSAALEEFSDPTASVTKANIVAFFNLDAAEEAELDTLISWYQMQPNDAAKSKWLDVMRRCFQLAEAKAPGYTTNAALSARLNQTF